MDLKHGVLTALLLAGLAAPASAQNAAAPPQGSIDASRLGIDVNRIHRQLQQDAGRDQHDRLNLKYYIDVYGTTPALRLFENRKEAVEGPVPYGSPTHREMLEMSTPQEYRAPVMDFGALMRWLADKSSSR